MFSTDPITSWADEAEAESRRENHLPLSTVIFKNGLKIVTSYRRNENNKVEKVVRIYKTEQRKVLKAVAARRLWKKFGDSALDKSGPSPTNTFIGEEVKVTN